MEEFTVTGETPTGAADLNWRGQAVDHEEAFNQAMEYWKKVLNMSRTHLKQVKIRGKGSTQNKYNQTV